MADELTWMPAWSIRELSRTAPSRPCTRATQQPPEVEHVDAFADLLDERHVVLDEQDPGPLFSDHPVQDLPELLRFGLVEA
jgi:hypothetical protein